MFARVRDVADNTADSNSLDRHDRHPQRPASAPTSPCCPPTTRVSWVMRQPSFAARDSWARPNPGLSSRSSRSTSLETSPEPSSAPRPPASTAASPSSSPRTWSTAPSSSRHVSATWQATRAPQATVLAVKIFTVDTDYDNDGFADPAVYQPSTNLWSIAQSTLGSRFLSLGQTGDIPVSGDFNGDGKTDPAVFRPVQTGPHSPSGWCSPPMVEPPRPSSGA